MTTTEEVETRLRSLSGSATLRPADERALAELHFWPKAKSPLPRKHTAIRIAAAAAAAVVVVLLANIGAAYFAPKYERAVADSPGLGQISQRFLSAVGLNGSDVTVIGDSSTSGGHTLKLVGAYADGLRTVLFVSIDGKGVSGNPKLSGRSPGEWGINYNDMTLTDQFAHSYGGAGTGGPTDLQFEALAWPASEVGARLTLHITGLEAMWKIAAFGPNRVIDTEALTTHGDWALHVTLISSPAHAIGLPAPLHTPEADYTFTGISASETEMVVHWNVSGSVNDRMAKERANAAPNADPFGDPLFDQYFRPHVYSEAGTELQFQDFGYAWPKTGPAKGGMTVFITGPGRYRVQFGDALTAPDQQRWVVVP